MKDISLEIPSFQSSGLLSEISPDLSLGESLHFAFHVKFFLTIELTMILLLSELTELMSGRGGGVRGVCNIF